MPIPISRRVIVDPRQLKTFLQRAKADGASIDVGTWGDERGPKADWADDFVERLWRLRGFENIKESGPLAVFRFAYKAYTSYIIVISGDDEFFMLVESRGKLTVAAHLMTYCRMTGIAVYARAGQDSRVMLVFRDGDLSDADIIKSASQRAPRWRRSANFCLGTPVAGLETFLEVIARYTDMWPCELVSADER